MPACELKIGQTLLLSNGECVIIEDIKIKRLSKPETTYNFEVEDFHTYYVTESAILVHNMCANNMHTEDQKALIELAKENSSGVTRSEANTLVEWANEYGISNHGPMVHPNRTGIWSYTEHIKIFKYHIPIIGG